MPMNSMGDPNNFANINKDKESSEQAWRDKVDVWDKKGHDITRGSEAVDREKTIENMIIKLHELQDKGMSNEAMEQASILIDQWHIDPARLKREQ